MENGVHARIADFGLTKITKDLDFIPDDSLRNGYNPRWAAPEVFDEGGKYSKEADVFSFAMVMIEVRRG